MFFRPRGWAWIFATLAGGSVALGGLHGDVLTWHCAPHVVEVGLYWGDIHVDVLPGYDKLGPRRKPSALRWPQLSRWRPGWTRPTFDNLGVPGVDTIYILTLPVWIPGALFACAALAVSIHRRKRGICRCGYDLTGNVSGICPECGTPVRGRGRSRVVTDQPGKG